MKGKRSEVKRRSKGNTFEHIESDILHDDINYPRIKSTTSHYQLHISITTTPILKKRPSWVYNNPPRSKHLQIGKKSD
jgi:hypothetical protein